MAEHLAVGGRCTTIAHRQDRNVSSRRLWDQLVGNTCGQWLIYQRAQILSSFETLNTLFGVISSLTLDEIHHFTADTAITLVEKREIVGITVSIWNAIWSVSAGSVHQRRNDQFCESRCRHRNRDSRGHQHAFDVHIFSSVRFFIDVVILHTPTTRMAVLHHEIFSGGTAIISFSP